MSYNPNPYPCRFLNNAQSAADSAHFMANVKLPGIDEDLTAPSHPWIYYGVRPRLVCVPAAFLV